jgi:hypothetical protein|tara:strand:+ start:150 stop:257 length:108 start_codon:yes stop_codon:yes gene_type:complete
MFKEITIAIILAMVFAVIGGVAEYRYDLIHQFLNK